MTRPRVVAFVHAKGRSERVPSKNLRLLGDRPLFCHAIANALAAERVERVVIDSDSDEILELGKAHGAVPLKRPPELATNATSGDDLAYWQASSEPHSDIVLQVIPTAPFLKPHSIDRAVTMLEAGDVDSVAGVFSDVLYEWKAGRPTYYRSDGTLPNSSELVPTVFETTGLYANLTQAVLRTRKRMNPDKVAPLFLSRLEAIDINTPEDFAFAEVVERGLGLDRGQKR
jgi:CMP-N-acetylneuraminic acid synthetase